MRELDAQHLWSASILARRFGIDFERQSQVIIPMKVRHVALLVETSREYGRGLLRGIIRYHQEHGPWSVFFEPHGLGDPPPAWLRSWRGDGVLARINDRRMADAILKTGIPVVDLRGALGDLGVATVGVDNCAVVQLAFQHFLDRGFRHFAFCGTPRGEYRYQDERADRFLSIVADRGMACDAYFSPRPFSWEEEQGQMAKWLKGLPKPVAIMTCHDDRGLQVLDACVRVGLDVPAEVAILGVDNDPFLCNLSRPPLSSIDVNSEWGGYVAAELLDVLMDGRQPPSLTCRYAPRWCRHPAVHRRDRGPRSSCRPCRAFDPGKRVQPDEH